MGKKNKHKKKDEPESSYEESASEEYQGESDPAEDVNDTDDEGASGYRKGGYHPVQKGEVYNNRYRVLCKLGWGHFSTVWLCLDSQTKDFVAMKVQKSATHYTEAAQDEIKLLGDVSKHAAKESWYKQVDPAFKIFTAGIATTCVVKLRDNFMHSGKHGKHVCMIFDVCGPNVLGLAKQYDYKGAPTKLVQKIAAQTLLGLDFLHRVCGIIHTDLKPENVVVSIPNGIPVNRYGEALVDREAAIEETHAKMEALPLPSDKGQMSKAEKKRLKKKEKKQRAKDAAAKMKQDVAASSGAAGSGEAAVEEEVDCHGLKDQIPRLVSPMPDEAVDEALKNQQSKNNDPPYVRPTLQPSRSDPTLLSTYGDTRALWYKMPYHHLANNRFTEQQPKEEDSSKVDPVNQETNGLAPKPTADDAPEPFAPAVSSAGPDAGARKNGRASTGIKVCDDIYDRPDAIFSIVDLGNACWTDKKFTNEIQTRQYRSPEAILQAGYDCTTDLWSLACMLFELMTGDFLFDPKSCQQEGYSRDEDHIALITELLGKVPATFLDRCPLRNKFFSKQGDLRNIKKLKFWPLGSVLVKKYHWQPIEAANFVDFVTPMLEIDPRNRAPAYLF